MLNPQYEPGITWYELWLPPQLSDMSLVVNSSPLSLAAYQREVGNIHT